MWHSMDGDGTGCLELLWGAEGFVGGGAQGLSSLGVQSSLCWDPELPPQWSDVHWDHVDPWGGLAGPSVATHFWHSSSTKARGWSSPDMVITVSLSNAPSRLWSTVCRVMVDVV